MSNCDHSDDNGAADPALAPGLKQLPPASVFADDDGSADAVLADLLAQYHRHGRGLAEIVAKLATTRVLIPMMTELVAHGYTEDNLKVDKEAETGIVAVATGDGRTALPAFTSMDSLTSWHAQARPVPVLGARAALASVAEGWSLLVIDPAGPHTAVIPRPAVWALAQQRRWEPVVVEGVVDATVSNHVVDVIRQASPAVRQVTCVADPLGPERVIIELRLVDGLTRGDLDTHIARINHALSSSSIIADRIDALALKLRR